MAMATIWCNGEWLDSDSPSVAWTDRGLLHGLGLFETLLAVDGRPIHVERHLARLDKGLDRFGWEKPAHDLGAGMTELLKRNQLSHGRARIRLAMTAGSGGLNNLKSGEDQKIWMTASALEEGKDSLSLGLGLWRRNEHSALAGLKCASYAENLVAMDWARREGYDEVLFLNARGDLCEAATANVFVVINGVLFTPNLESGCLPGVAREVLIELAKGAGIPVREDSLQLDDMQHAEECFLSSATRGPVPVARFVSRELYMGSITEQLIELWEDSITPR